MALVAALTPAFDYRVGDEEFYVGTFAVSGETIVRPGWLAENGALVSRTTYAKLFAEIGFAYSPTPGTDPGSNQFFLPDRTDGRANLPRGATNFPTRGAKGGAQTVALDAAGAQDPSHPHGVPNNRGAITPDGAVGAKDFNGGVAYTGPDLHAGTYFGPGTNSGTTGGPASFGTSGIVGGAGGAPAAHQNMPPGRVCGGWIVRYV